jgi:hypothetical protein
MLFHGFRAATVCERHVLNDSPAGERAGCVPPICHDGRSRQIAAMTAPGTGLEGGRQSRQRSGNLRRAGDAPISRNGIWRVNRGKKQDRPRYAPARKKAGAYQLDSGGFLPFDSKPRHAALEGRRFEAQTLGGATGSSHPPVGAFEHAANVLDFQVGQRHVQPRHGAR